MSKATDNLRDHQQQLDEDGVMVGVSRQALVETLAEVDRLQKVVEFVRTFSTLGRTYIRQAEVETMRALAE